MKRYLYLILLVAPAIALPAQAGIFSFKPNTARPNPDAIVPGLLYTVKADPDEGKRADAATQLRDFDARLFPDIVPVLVDVLQHDTKPCVRRAAAKSLGCFPVTPLAGKALHEASTNDPSLKVRLHAWTAYVGYQLHGYHELPTAPPAKVVGTAEPLPPDSHTTITYTANSPKTSPTATPAAPNPRPTIFSRTLPVQATPVSNVPAKVSPPAEQDDGPVLNPQK